MSVEKGRLRDQTFVYLHGGGLKVVVRGEDWAKLLPYLMDGTFSSEQVANPRIVSAVPKNDLGIADQQDPYLYEKVLGTLQLLFPTKFPQPK